MSDAEETRADRKRRVESVVGTIRHNTGGPNQPSNQRPGLRIAHLKGNFSLRGEAPGATERALRAALERGDVFGFTDEEGMTRYATVDDEGIRAVLAVHGIDTVAEAVTQPAFADCDDADDVRDVIEQEAGSDDPDRGVIAWGNRLLAALEEIDDAE